MFQSPKANSAIKPVTPLEDADLATHLCPVKWQRQYDLIENSTPVSTRALLMVLENIKSNVEINDKPPSKDKAKGADSKRKAESNDSRNPKKAKKGWTEKHCSLCNKHGGVHTTHNTKKCPQEGRRDAQTQQACKWKGWDELCLANPYCNQKGSTLCT